MSQANNIEPDDIHEYVDGRLDAPRRVEIADYLARNPSAAADAEAIRALNESLKELRHDVLSEEPPERLRRIVQQPAPRMLPFATRTKSWVPTAVAASAAFLAGIAIGWLGHIATIKPVSEIDVVLRQSAYAYSFFSGDNELPVEFAPDNLSPFETWVQSAFGRRLPPPDLSGAGFSLRGSRLLPSASFTAGFYQFDRDGGGRYSLYFWPSQSPQAGNIITANRPGVSVRVWYVENVGFAFMAEQDDTDIDSLAENVVMFYSEMFKQGNDGDS